MYAAKSTEASLRIAANDRVPSLRGVRGDNEVVAAATTAGSPRLRAQARMVFGCIECVVEYAALFQKYSEHRFCPLCLSRADHEFDPDTELSSHDGGQGYLLVLQN